MTQSKLTLNQPTASSNANTPVVAWFQSEALADVVLGVKSVCYLVLLTKEKTELCLSVTL